MSRPRIAVPGRFTESASALRYAGVVSSRRLLETVWAAGGDPVVLLPAPGPDATDWACRLDGFQGVLLPGGGDLRPTRYGMPDDDPSLYDVDDLQDDIDLSLAAYALDEGVPLLAVCRGLHVVNALRGGTLVIDMVANHRHRRHTISLAPPAAGAGFSRDRIDVSCYHHQAIDRLADGLTAVGWADDGVIEAVTIDSTGWAAGVQWHPEDTWDSDADQLLPFRRLVAAARDAGRG